MSNRKTILVVEDDALILDTLAMHLAVSYDVLVARDGLDAASVYESNIERVVAIVTDWDMPRLDGGSLAEWVHHISPRLPIIIMSGNIPGREDQDFTRGPMTNFLVKPFEPSQLEALLNEFLDRE
jgi:DNA-binding NtrC family response regulator